LLVGGDLGAAARVIWTESAASATIAGEAGVDRTAGGVATGGDVDPAVAVDPAGGPERVKPAGAVDPIKERLKDLIAFSISEEYFTCRKQLGLAIA
jgi:hypothetical protein